MTSPFGHPQGVGLEPDIWSVDRSPQTTAVRAGTTANIASFTNATLTHDGVTLVAGERLLVKNQIAPAENGLYAVGSGSTLVRVPPLHAEQRDLRPGMLVYVQEGTTQSGFWILRTPVPIVMGTTALSFTQIPDGADAVGSPTMQAVGATLASGTATINTGIAVASTTEVVPLLIGNITGSTNFASLRELKASRVIGNPGTVVVQAVGSDGLLDVDAAGAIRVILLTPQS